MLWEELLFQEPQIHVHVFNTDESDATYNLMLEGLRARESSSSEGEHSMRDPEAFMNPSSSSDTNSGNDGTGSESSNSEAEESSTASSEEDMSLGDPPRWDSSSRDSLGDSQVCISRS